MPNFMISSQCAHYIDLFHRLLLPSRLESTLKTSDPAKNIFDKNMFLHQSISGTADDTPVLLLEAYSKYVLNMQAIPLGLVAFIPP